ncbi:hypothetical protein FAVG1_07831 [Fusarium avenaceum]|nr:hypothetical protein FAVG1_07831 [Fusarium avenaceum]
MADFLDRRKRVRTALWIYASIFITKLPPGTHFWTNLPIHLQFFHKTLVTRCQDRLEVLDLELNRAIQNEFDRYRTAGQRMASTLRESDPHNGLEVTRTLLRAHDWQQLNNSPALAGDLLESKLTDQYVSIQGKAILCPRDSSKSKSTAYIFFGKLIDMANAPTIRHDSFFSFCPGMSPSNAYFVLDLEKFQRRSRGLSDPSYCDSCLTRQARFLDLAGSFGEAAIFFGSEPNAEILSPDLITSMCNVGYHQSKRLLIANGVWLQNSCSKLNGLLQALDQIRDPRRERSRVRTFQRLLRRKVRNAFGPDILEPRQPSYERKYSALLTWCLVKKAVFPFLQHQINELPKHVDEFFFETSRITERVFEGCYAIADEPSLSQCVFRILRKIQSEFLFHYCQRLGPQPNPDFDIKLKTMERLISAAMTALYDWYQVIDMKGRKDWSPPEELLEALRLLAEEPIEL